MKEKYEICDEVSSCEEKGKLVRVPSFSSVLRSSHNSKGAVGQVVRDNIKQAREELKQQQRAAKREAEKKQR